MSGAACPTGAGEADWRAEGDDRLLYLDADLVAAAATRSPSGNDDTVSFRKWATALSAKEKGAWLRRAVDELELALGGEMLRAFRATTKERRLTARRTAGGLLALAEQRVAQRGSAKAARATKARSATGKAR